MSSNNCMDIETVSKRKGMCISIPHDLMEAGIDGIAGAVTYLCCMDIVRYMMIQQKRGVCVKDKINESLNHNYRTAVAFLTRPHNPLYPLELPGDELIKEIERRVNEANI